jgi:hypothetical protein
VVDLRGVEPLTSPVREKQGAIRLPAQTSDFPAQAIDSTVINDHELSPVRTSDDDQMMTKLQHVAVEDPHLNDRCCLGVMCNLDFWAAFHLSWLEGTEADEVRDVSLRPRCLHPEYRGLKLKPAWCSSQSPRREVDARGSVAIETHERVHWVRAGQFDEPHSGEVIDQPGSVTSWVRYLSTTPPPLPRT